MRALRIIAWFAAMPVAAWSFAGWGFTAMFGRLRPEIAEKFANGFGLSDPRMLEHWDRLQAQGWRMLGHNLKNILVEWARLDAQRAAKALSFVGAVGWLGFIAAAGAAAWLLLAPDTAHAASGGPPCAPYEEMVRILSKSYGEQLAGVGIDWTQVARLEIWASPETGTWSLITIVAGSPRACLVRSGSGWRSALPGEPA